MITAPLHKDYSGTPLDRKLGLTTSKGHAGEVALLGEPANFRTLLGDLPNDLQLHQRLRPTANLALCFVRTREELAALLELLSAQLPAAAHFWILHPKAHTKPHFNQNDVRDAALAAGFVDYKVCSVDADWSGLKFSRRKQAWHSHRCNQ